MLRAAKSYIELTDLRLRMTKEGSEVERKAVDWLFRFWPCEKRLKQLDQFLHRGPIERFVRGYMAGDLKVRDGLIGGRGELSQNGVLPNGFENGSSHEIP